MHPKRRKPPKSGIQRAPRREYPGHRKWIRGCECAVNDFGRCTIQLVESRIECAHVRIGADGGLSKKPSDFFTYPLCHYHHAEQHQVGEPAFEKRYRPYFPKGLRATALEYARRSPSYFKDDEFREGVNKALEGK